MPLGDWTSKDKAGGRFIRQTSQFRDEIEPASRPGAKFPAEAGRYRLYVSLACPWAHRTLIARELKGLHDIVAVTVVDWHMGEKGWRFSTPEETPGTTVDPLGNEYLRDLYFKADPGYAARFTVPVLWDTKASTIVNNESSEIIRMMNTAFDEIVADEYKGVSYYPEDLRAEIDELNGWVYDKINNGVYKAGFAATQEAYEENVYPLFDALDRVEKILAESEGDYLLGKTLTEADVRLYTTIVRFDPVYVQHFKCNIRTIRNGYPHIDKWLRKLYWTHPAFKNTTDFEHIKKHYTKSHPQINPFGVTPVGPLPNILPL